MAPQPVSRPDHIRLRAATAEDGDFIYRLVEQTMRGYVEQTWGAYSAELTRNGIDESMAAGSYSILEYEGRDVGAHAVERCPAHIQLASLFILPDFQNRGMGTVAVRRLVDESERSGKPLRLRVLAVNPARTLYEREGFVVTATTHERVYMQRRPLTSAVARKALDTDAVIRRLSGSAADAYQHLRLRALSEDPASFALSHAEQAYLSLKEVAARLDDPDFAVLGAYDGNLLVGMIGLARERLAKLSHKAHVWGVYVTPEYRRAGIGKRLVAAVLDAARSIEGVEQLIISVYAANEGARSLYVRAGFVPFGVERRAVRVEGHYYDEEHFVCFLKS